MSELKIQAWSAVNEALHLDSEGSNTEAYKKYLEGIRKLCIYLEEESVLIDDKNFEIDQLVQQKCMQVISVMKKSVERVEQFVSNQGKPSSIGQKKPSVENNQISTSSFGFEYPIIESMSQPTPVSVKTLRADLSPIEKARRENGLIYRAYQARCKLVKDSKKRASLYLELHRKLTENIIVARAKEAVVRQQQIEKEKGILELAAKKLDLKGGIPNQVTNNTEDWEKLLLYAQIIQYEENEVWTRDLRKKLDRDPKNESLIAEVIKTTLSSSNHPLSLWVCKYQNQLLERIHFFLKDNEEFLKNFPLPDITIEDQVAISPSKSLYEFSNDEEPISPKNNKLPNSLTGDNVSLSKMPLNKMWVEDDVLSLFDPLAGEKCVSKVPYSSFIDPEHERMNSLRTRLTEIIKDTCKAIEMLVQMMCATYELTDDVAQDISYHMAENSLFQGVWPQLLVVFRVINYHSEMNMSLVMEKLSTSPPEEVGIPPYFDLESCQEEAIAGLQRISTLNTPLAKLHQLVKVAHIVCSKKTHHASGKPFGADDLIGIMCYLLVQTKMPHLVSEFEALEQLVPHRYLMGEEGYALTTHLTAMKYLESQLHVETATNNLA